MINLIIAEKPSVARDIATAVKATNKKDGYYEGNNYIVTWAVGHLLEPAMPEDYNPELQKWNITTLPIIPQIFKIKPNPKTHKQLKTISTLLKRTDINKVIIATDAGREGELIAREILDFSGFKHHNKLYRLWTSEALTPEVIRKCLNNLKPASNFDRLYYAAKARQQADWLVGINLSRAFTCATGSNSTFSIGRVQTAVLALLVDRRREIDNFKPTPYWNVTATFTKSDGTSWTGIYINQDNETQIFDQKLAQSIAETCKGKPATITQIKSKQQKTPPPLLFSLTVLQQEANRLFSMTANQTLAIAQKLYETYKVISYPRTDSQYLATSNVDLVHRIIKKLSANLNHLTKHIKPDLVNAKNSRVFNDKKLTDHHAIIPLDLLPKEASEDEQKIYTLIVKRFIAAFCDDYQYTSTTITTVVDGKHQFTTTGKVTINHGWKIVYDYGKSSDTHLPALNKNDTAITAETKTVEKQTEPPPEYTDATLLKDMTNPAKYLNDPALKEIYKGEVGLGTQSTRAQIIETLIQRQYAVRSGKTIRATEKGCFLIDNLRNYPVLTPLTEPDNTAQWEMELEAIAQGKKNMTSFLAQITDFVKNAVSTISSNKIQQFTAQTKFTSTTRLRRQKPLQRRKTFKKARQTP